KARSRQTFRRRFLPPCVAQGNIADFVSDGVRTVDEVRPVVRHDSTNRRNEASAHSSLLPVMTRRSRRDATRRHVRSTHHFGRAYLEGRFVEAITEHDETSEA